MEPAHGAHGRRGAYEQVGVDPRAPSVSADAIPRVLVADHNLITRQTTKHVLIRDFGAEVTEAVDGMDTIERLSTRAFSFLVLDLDLPVIDGLRVLEILREGPDDAAMPTIAIAESPDESTVRQLIELGVADLVLRPVERHVLSQRFARFMQRHRHAIGRDDPAKDGAARPARSATTRVMIADGDANFRHFVTSALHGKAAVTEAATGVAALKTCLQQPPDIVLVGHDLGLLKSNLLVREMRRAPALRETRIIAIAPQNHLESVVSSANYDGVLVRTYIPTLFTDQFDHLFQATGLTRLMALYPALQASLVSAVEQVFGMMLGVDVAALTTPDEGPSGPVVSSQVAIRELTEGLRLQFELTMPAEHARLAAARMLQVDDSDSLASDSDAALGEIANIVAGRLRTAMNERGISVHCELPAIRHHTIDAWSTSSAARDAMVVFFGAGAQDLCICATLSGVARPDEPGPEAPGAAAPAR